MHGTCQGLAATFELLSKTGNEAAVESLVGALDSPYAKIRNQALEALLSRRSLAGHREVIRRLHQLDSSWLDVIPRFAGRMTTALREAILSPDNQTCANGCRLLVLLREYELTAVLLTVLGVQGNPNSELACHALMALADAAHAETAKPEECENPRDRETIRRYVIEPLEASVRRYGERRRREMLESFLLLADRDSSALREILESPHHPAFLVMVEILSKSIRQPIMQLLLSFLDDPRPPSAAISLIGKRSDRPFVELLLHKAGQDLSPPALANLRRINAIGWLRDIRPLLDPLDDLAQCGAVRLAVGSAIPRQRAFGVVEHLLLHGKQEARRAAAAALVEFNGAEANALALKALRDSDPQVQANIVPQLRGRGIPGVLTRMVSLLDSPHALVRQAVRESLTELSFRHYLNAFETLDDAGRRSTGALIKKIDLQTVPLLKAQLASPMRTRRLRGLAIVQAMDAVGEMESSLVRMLQDEDHIVRVEAATVLARGRTPASLDALRKATDDQSRAVQDAARRSLAERSDRTNRRLQKERPS